MDLHPANQGGPDEESAAVSSQVSSSQTAFRMHRNFPPRKSEATIVESVIFPFPVDG